LHFILLKLDKFKIRKLLRITVAVLKKYLRIKFCFLENRFYFNKIEKKIKKAIIDN